MRFLIVDENKDIRIYLGELILDKKDEFIESADATELNSDYNIYKPDWILMSIQMKKINGFKAAEKLKNEFPSARFVLISDFNDEHLRKKAEKLGAAAFIPKENLFEFYEIINRTGV